MRDQSIVLLNISGIELENRKAIENSFCLPNHSLTRGLPKIYF